MKNRRLDWGNSTPPHRKIRGLLRPLRPLCLIVAALLSAPGAARACNDCDSLRAADRARRADKFNPLAPTDPATQIRRSQWVGPGILITVGALGIGSGGQDGALNTTVRRAMGNLRGEAYFHADDYLQYLPVVSYVGLGAVGARHRHTFTERILVTATSYLTMGILVNGLKYSVRDLRPDGSSRNSFPSGHTATAFMGAELVRSEYGTGYGIAAYTVACGIGFLRLYNNRHWVSDVLVGAGIGILSARVGYWLLPANRRLFGLDRRDRQRSEAALATAPFYDPRTRALGGALALRF